MKMGGLFHTPAALTPEKSPQYELNRELYVSEEQIWTLWK
jgi:hypothetical protein